ncbi:VPS10, VPS10 domain protein (plasmid) [Bacillus cereus]|uniref:F510_1955 family glycosylhydrolase n=1 Tax=Bacillus cereus group TaxID=86661 RepID=UPI0005A3201B|nr:VPS10, VPS10 domain protein [Bacillus cereus]AJH60302.1 BNR/Asp-box repeat family protein [Bacillus cereus]AJK37370.1 BNR/Asp-box repeat family protein [Bacillus cereus]QKH69352.1 VPS10, VPS10 domain protein [Bacillus cereus]QKH71449.1 VPS10, VPS10 domain protein [Bacillus cereus]
MKKILISSLAITSIFTVAACSNGQETSPKKEEVSQSKQATNQKNNVTSNVVPQDFYKEISSGKIEHIHGIGYPGNLPGVSIATHNGIKVYQNGKWLETKEQKHDYMGFQATKNGFFASGHPEPGSDLKNLLGLIKSNDGGASFKKLAFYGESDFHNLGAGYNNETVYVYNERPNSKLKNGFYYSTDNGNAWKQSKLDGLSTAVSSFAVHPDKSSVVAMSTKNGIYLSTDNGNTFKSFSKSQETTALTLGSEDIIYSYITEQQQGLTKQPLATSQGTDLKIPSLDSKDQIMYISQNPQNPAEIVFATIKANVFLTTDDGKTWKQIVKNGNLEYN